MLIWSTVLQICVSVVGACSLFTISPLVDLFLDPKMTHLSPTTQKAIGVLRSIGLPVNIESWLLVLVVFVILTSLFQVLARNSIFKIKYAVLKDLMMGIFEDFFNARWYFFSNSQQGVLLNTFNREMAVVGDAFGAMALFFAGILQVFFFMAVPLYVSWQVTLISFSIAIVLAVPFILLGRMSYRWGKLNTSTANKLSTVVFESFNLIKIILGFGNQRVNVQKFN